MATSKLERAEKFADELAQHLGDNLVSVFAFGAQVRQGYGIGHADLNLLLIVNDASTEALRPIEPPISRWANRREPPPLIFTHDEWRNSTDVFPMEVEDMREAHRLLKGADPFAGLVTTRVHLRHELEREIRGKILQLRREYTAVAPDGKALTRLLIDSVNTFFVLMRGLVRLVGGTPQSLPAELVQQAAEAVGLDADAFDWVVRKISGKTVNALRPYDPVGAKYVEEIEKMAVFVDQFDINAEPKPQVSSVQEGQS
jgi:hypothetical protein